MPSSSEPLPTLDDLDKADVDGVVAPHPRQAHGEDAELCDDGRDDHGEPEGGQAVPLEEGHQVAEAAEEHHEDVDAQRVGLHSNNSETGF